MKLVGSKASLHCHGPPVSHSTIASASSPSSSSTLSFSKLQNILFALKFQKPHHLTAMAEVALNFCPDPSSLAFFRDSLSVVPRAAYLDRGASEVLGDEEEDPFVHYGRDPEHPHESSQELADTSLLPLPKAFLEFLAKSGIDPRIYSAAKILPRYVRIKPGFEHEVPSIEDELGFQLSPLSWLRGFFSLSQEAQIAGCQAYQLGKMYGMDAASGAAVQALGVLPGDHVLDLCAAPGAKLCMLADCLGTLGTLTGVDIARHRLAACRTMLLKYKIGRHCRLFVTDGTKFSLLPSRQTVSEQDKISQHSIKFPCCEVNKPQSNNLHASNFKGICNGYNSIFGEWKSRSTYKEKRNAKRDKLKNMGGVLDEEPELLFYGKDSGVVGLKREDLFENTCKDGRKASEFGYDKVLVDVECTHDGSLRHICKYEQWGWETLERRVLDHDRLLSLTYLQLQLLTNGFKLLKVGGTLLYSTCSFTTAQNEEVVEKFLARHSNAELVEIESANTQKWPCKRGLLAFTLRFDPMVSRTSGLFMAKITKLHTKH